MKKLFSRKTCRFSALSGHSSGHSKIAGLALAAILAVFPTAGSSNIAQAETYSVGAGKNFSTLESLRLGTTLKNGDEIALFSDDMSLLHALTLQIYGGQDVAFRAGDANGAIISYGGQKNDAGRLVDFSRGTFLFGDNLSFTQFVSSENGGVGRVTQNGTIVTENATFYGNSADGQGGVFYSDGSIVDIVGGVFLNNSANAGGVAAALGGKVSVNGAEVISNTAYQAGGAFRVESGTLSLTDTLLWGNEAYQSSPTAMDGHGGALYLDHASATVQNSMFSGNGAQGLGGAIYVEGNSSLTVGANAGKETVFVANSDGRGSNAIHFNLDSEAGNAVTQRFSVVGNGDVRIADSIRAEKSLGNRGTLIIDKSGLGTLTLGDSSNIGTLALDAGLNSTLNVKEGGLALASGSGITIGEGTFTLAEGTTLTALGHNTIYAASPTTAGQDQKAIVLQDGSRVELSMLNMFTGDDPTVPLLTLDGGTSDGNDSISVGRIVIDATNINAYDGDGEYVLVQADGADFAQATLLIGGKEPSTAPPVNDRAGNRTVKADADKIILELSGVDANRRVIWNGITDGLWSENAATWDVTGSASTAFLNGDDVEFGSAHGVVTDITVDEEGVSVQGMTISGGDYSFRGGEIQTPNLDMIGNAGVSFDSRAMDMGVRVQYGVTAGLAALDEAELILTNRSGTATVTGLAGSEINIGKLSGTGVIRFTDTSNTAGDGGAVLGDTVRIFGGMTKFSGNSTGGYGGAIFARNLDIAGGSVVFENNVAHERGGAIYATENISISANGGDVVFCGNQAGASGMANAIFMENAASSSLRLTAASGQSILFFDPVENAAGGTLGVAINGAGTVRFDRYRSNIRGTTVVSNGTLLLTKGAIYGAESGNDEFSLKSGATLEANGAGNGVSANEIILQGNSTIRINLKAADTLGGDPALTLDGKVLIQEGEKINLDVVQTSQDGVFNVLSASNVDFEDHVVVTVNGTALSTELRNDRYGSREFSFVVGSVLLELEGFDQNRTIAWTGSENDVWSEDDANWKVSTGSQFFLNGDVVEFTDPDANQSVSVARSGVVVGGMRVAGGSYTFDGGSIVKATNADEVLSPKTLLQKTGPGTLTLNQKNEFDQVVIHSGTLAGGNKNGFTIVGDLLVGFGANLRPGTHGAARFHLDGNAEFESGSFIYLDLGKTLDKSDQIHATGGIDFASDIEGTVTVVVAGNGVGQGSQTTDEAVILADGGLRLNGNILVDGVTLSGNDKVVIRDGGNKLVFQSDGSLTLQSTVVSGEGTELAIHAVGGSQQTTPAPGLSWNQLAVKSGLESAAAGNFANQLMAKYALQGGEEAKQSFLEQLLPTLNSAMPMVTQRAVTQFRQVNFERLRNLHLEPTNRYDQQFEGDRIRRWLQRQGGQAARSDTVRGQRSAHNAAPIIWLQNYGDFMKQGKQAVQGYESEAYGVSLGTERWLNRNTVVGLGFAGSFAVVRTDDNTQKADANTFIFSPYVSHLTAGGYKILASIGYAYNDYDMTRTPGGTTIGSSHTGNTFLMNAEVSKKIRGLWTDVSPFLGAELIYLDENGYQEKTGQGVTVARVDGRISESYLQTLGLRFGRTRLNRWGWIVNPAVSIGWIHDYGDGEIRAVSSYAGGAPFTIRGVSMNRDRVALGLNYAANVNERVSLFGGYNGEFASRFDVHTIQAGFTCEF